jgi:group I intron endonuclease
MVGIYKITNEHNGKYYIGQSKNIGLRWKKHTQSINNNSDESVIRMAFAKYGLRQQVSKPGIYSGFRFEIIETCSKEELLEKEKYYIESLKPDYNVMLMEPSEYFSPTNTYSGKHFIQYHSLEKMGYFPNYNESIYTDELNSGIFSKKRICKDLLGAKVVIILGGKPGKSKKTIYYLWSITDIETIEYNKIEKDYSIYGFDELFEYPISLNDYNGFDDFRQKCGNFSYGIQSIENYDFFKRIIKNLMKNKKVNREKYIEYLERFCELENRKYEK